eukprot:TRINITY_DN26731_c0_g1_i1.p1 TRINITY_DN26731_c0_g1~~TRINITY_DN26731_c0_g1_i1.p1  ORF type:complete len:528 (+),score=70.33 TRINITY_DN26731_c0_g1_i1:38-1585(+)
MSVRRRRNAMQRVTFSLRFTAAFFAAFLAAGSLALRAKSRSQREASLRLLPHERPPLQWFQQALNFHFPKLYAQDLGSATFDATLTSSNAAFVIVDFYMPWCPHCQHWAPDYERLALAIQRFDQSHANQTTGLILAATVDCVQDADLCTHFNISSYPKLLFGKREDWLASKKETLQTVSVDPRTAETVADWIDNHTGSLAKLRDGAQMPKKKEVSDLFHSMVMQDPANRQSQQSFNGSQVNYWDVKLSTALLLHNIFNSHPLPVDQKREPSKTVLDLVDLLERRFPEEASSTGEKAACSSNFARLGRVLKDDWSSVSQVAGHDAEGVNYSAVDPALVEANWRLCGDSWEDLGATGFQQCRGTWPGRRGYTCGLWELFHVMTVQGDDASAAGDMDVLRRTIQHFFDCEECRDHFFTIPYDASKIRTRKDAALWFWSAHNNANSRVAGLEEQYEDWDPNFPKVQWPTPALCPSCRKPAVAPLRGSLNIGGENWDDAAVFTFLRNYYSPALTLTAKSA